LHGILVGLAHVGNVCRGLALISDDSAQRPVQNGRSHRPDYNEDDCMYSVGYKATGGTETVLGGGWGVRLDTGCSLPTDL
jgi:hypothetical protein